MASILSAGWLIQFLSQTATAMVLAMFGRFLACIDRSIDDASTKKHTRKALRTSHLDLASSYICTSPSGTITRLGQSMATCKGIRYIILINFQLQA